MVLMVIQYPINWNKGWKIKSKPTKSVQREVKRSSGQSWSLYGSLWPCSGRWFNLFGHRASYWAIMVVSGQTSSFVPLIPLLAPLSRQLHQMKKKREISKTSSIDFKTPQFATNATTSSPTNNHGELITNKRLLSLHQCWQGSLQEYTCSSPKRSSS